MKKLYLLFPIACFSMLLQSCFFDQTNHNVPSFYTKKSWGNGPSLPLAYPLSILQDRVDGLWFMDDFIFQRFDHSIGVDSIFYIGVEGFFVYGSTSSKFYNSTKYPKAFVYADKYGGIIYSEATGIINPDKKELIRQFNEMGESYVVTPKRYFLANTQDSTLQVFFLEKEYQQELKDNNISGIMYNLDSVQDIFLETGILPWFPDSIKAEIGK